MLWYCGADLRPCLIALLRLWSRQIHEVHEALFLASVSCGTLALPRFPHGYQLPTLLLVCASVKASPLVDLIKRRGVRLGCLPTTKV